MWAQGLTIGIMIGAGILTHSARQEAAKHHTEDHSWRQLVRRYHTSVATPYSLLPLKLAEQEREKDALKVRQMQPSA